MRDDSPDFEVLRRMTPARKLAVMHALIRQAYVLKAAGLRAMHPELSEPEIRARTRALIGRV